MGIFSGKRLLAVATMTAGAVLGAAPAHAWYVDITIVGAGRVYETTDANEIDEHCTSYPEEGFSSPSSTPTGVLGATCRAGDAGGDYGHGWIVRYVAEPASGYRFAGWRAGSGETETSVKCDGADGSSSYAGPGCQFQIFQNLQTQAVFVDDTAPSMASLHGPTTQINGPATFTFGASSDPTFSHFECRLVTGAEAQVHDWQTCSSGVQRDPAPAGTEGTYKLYVRAVDRSNNTSTPLSSTWSVDKINPETSLHAGPSGLTTTTSATFDFSSTSSDVNGYRCSIDGGEFSVCQSPTSYSGLGQGEHTFRVKAVDDANNLDATPATRTWTVDTVAPQTSITSGPAEGSTRTDQTATFTFTRSESGTFECQLDGAGWTACESPRAYTALSEGLHTFKVRARDVAGNVDPVPATRTWTVDTVAPDTRLDSGPSGLTMTTSATFDFSSTSGDVNGYECSLDGTAFTACPAPKSYSNLGQGEHTFQVRARDAAGNVDATPAARTWTVDTVAPQTSITSGPAEGSTTADQTATFSFSGNESGTFECQLDSGAWTACASPQSYAGLSEGAHTFAVRARDVAGNVDGSPAVRAWTVDVPAPPAPLPPPPPSTGTPTPTPATMTVRSTFRHRVSDGRTTVRTLKLSRLPRASTVKVTCKGKGRSCAFKAKTLKPTTSAVTLTQLFKNRKLLAGTVIEMRVTASGYVPDLFRYKTRKGSKPPLGGEVTPRPLPERAYGFTAV